MSWPRSRLRCRHKLKAMLIAILHQASLNIPSPFLTESENHGRRPAARASTVLPQERTTWRSHLAAAKLDASTCTPITASRCIAHIQTVDMALATGLPDRTNGPYLVAPSTLEPISDPLFGRKALRSSCPH
jgi:hypothetical protein